MEGGHFRLVIRSNFKINESVLVGIPGQHGSGVPSTASYPHASHIVGLPGPLGLQEPKSKLHRAPGASSPASQPVLPFIQKCRSTHPKNHLFLLSKKKIWMKVTEKRFI